MCVLLEGALIGILRQWLGLVARGGKVGLARCLRLPHSALLRDEAVLDDLVDVFLLSKATLVVHVHVAHLLADVGLVNTLWMDEAMTHPALVNERGSNARTVRRGGSLLVDPLSCEELLFREHEASSMDLLEGDVRVREVVVIHGILFESIHW